MNNSYFSSQIQSILSQLMLTLMNKTQPSTGGTPKATWVHAGDRYVDESAAAGGSANAAKFEDIIQQAAEKYDVDPELISSVIKAESNFNPKATSYCGAQGLMQLMPSTAAGLGVQDAYDPEQNIMGGAKLLHRLLTKYDGDVQLALAAYNAGSGAVDRYGGVPPYAETQTYVKRVMGYYQSQHAWNA